MTRSRSICCRNLRIARISRKPNNSIHSYLEFAVPQTALTKPCSSPHLILTDPRTKFAENGSMFLGDFHIHSTFSDGKLTIPQLVDLYGRRGFGAIAITDHLCENETLIGKASRLLKRTLTPATFPLYQNILASEALRAWDLYKMVLIPGFELTQNTVSNARSAHILGLGTTQYLSAEGDAIELIRSIHDQGALAIAAHPVNTGIREKQTYHLWDRREELREHFDAWEVASGSVLFDEVLRTDLPRIANSDLHHPRQMRSWKTKLKCEKKAEAILDAIRNQDISFHFYDEELQYAYG